MVSTAAFHARVRGSVPGLGGLKKTKMFLPHPRVKVSILISNPVSGGQCHLNHLTSLAYMCTKVAKKPDSFHFIFTECNWLAKKTH